MLVERKQLECHNPPRDKNIVKDECDGNTKLVLVDNSLGSVVVYFVYFTIHFVQSRSYIPITFVTRKISKERDVSMLF